MAYDPNKNQQHKTEIADRQAKARREARGQMVRAQARGRRAI